MIGPSFIEDEAGGIRPTPPHSIVDWHEIVHDDISSCWNGGLMGQSASMRAHILALGAVQGEDQWERTVFVLHQEGDTIVTGFVYE